MTIKSLKKKYSSSIDTTDLDLLLEFVLKKPREFLITHPEYNLSIIQQLRLRYFIGQLKKHKPIDYIIRRKEFYGLDFKITNHTLVPRPETEQMIDLASEIIFNNQRKNFTILDIGTGSGNIIIALLKKMQTTPLLRAEIQSYASDISQKALSVAKENALFHRLGIKFVKGNLLEPFNKLLTTQVTTPVISGCCGNVSASCNKLSKENRQSKILLITANLPYLSTKIYNNSAPKVKNYEPQTALVSGNDGLNHYRKLLNQLQKIHLNKNFSFAKTYLLLEISPEQKNKINKEIISKFPKAKITFHKDLAQKWRMVEIKI